MFRDEKGSDMARAGIVVAAGVAVGLAVVDFLQALVRDLLTPVISVFVGDFRFELNSFTISGSEFLYGEVIQYALVLLLVAAAAYWLIVRPSRRDRD